MLHSERARPAPACPDPHALLRWLSSSRAVSTDGAVHSWWNTAGTGYPYPEAAGLWLALVCREPEAHAVIERERVDSVARWLSRQVLQHGAAARHGRRYVFDSGIALDGLLAYEQAGGKVPVRAAGEALVAFIERGVLERQPVVPATLGPPSHWSNAFGGHLLKVAFALHRWAEHSGEERLRPVARQVVTEAMRHFDGERFLVLEGSRQSYLHAYLYGCEGLAWLDAHRMGRWAEELRRCAAAVSALQLPEGGIPPHWDGESTWGEPRADVAAQAIRVWLLTDPVAFREPIERALRFLSGLQTPEGGLRYHSGSDDVNTWCGLFAAQAILWQRAGADVNRLF